MTVTFEITPEEAQKIERAKAQGIDVNTLLRSLIAALPEPHFYDRASTDEWEAAMDELAEGSETLPVLPPEAYDRENMYEDRL